MGQVQSDAGADCLESVVAEEAAGHGQEEEEEEVEEEYVEGKEAIECNCIADLRTGPCGDLFSHAFLCFLNSTSLEKGSDCVHPFVALQNCIKANPDAFSKRILDENEDKNEDQYYNIYPPKWSKQPQTPNSKL